MHLITQYKGLPRQVYVICAARVITSMGSFIHSFTTLIMTGVLGMSDIAAGYMAVGQAVCALIGAMAGGRLADRFSRKRVQLSLMCMEICALIIGGFLVYSKGVLICMLSVSFCTGAFMPIMSAIIADTTGPDNRRESFSLMYLSINMGFAMGQIIAGQLFYNHTRWIFWGQAIFVAMSAALIYLQISDVRMTVSGDPLPASSQNTQKTSLAGFFRSVLADRVLTIFLIAIIAVKFCYAEISYLLPLQMSELSGLEVSSKMISYVWTVNAACCVIYAPILLPLTKRYSQIVNVAIACVLYLIGFGCYGFLRDASMIWVAVALVPFWTAGEVLIGTGTGVFVADRAKPEYRASYQSLYSLASDIGRMIGPVAMGYIIQVLTYSDGWHVVSALCGITILILIFGEKQFRKELYEEKSSR